MLFAEEEAQLILPENDEKRKERGEEEEEEEEEEYNSLLSQYNLYGDGLMEMEEEDHRLSLDRHSTRRRSLQCSGTTWKSCAGISCPCCAQTKRELKERTYADEIEWTAAASCDASTNVLRQRPQPLLVGGGGG